MAKKAHVKTIQSPHVHSPIVSLLRRFPGCRAAVPVSIKPTGLFGFVVLSAMLHGVFYGVLLTMPVAPKVNVKSITLVTFAASKPSMPSPVVVAEASPVPSPSEKRVPAPAPVRVAKPKPVLKPKVVAQPSVEPLPVPLESEPEGDPSVETGTVDLSSGTADIVAAQAHPAPDSVVTAAAGLSSGAVGRPSALARYVSIVQQRVQRQLRYPLKARKWKMQGTGEYRFVIRSDGALSNDEVVTVRSSGQQVLDRAAKQTIRRAAPFPKPPVDVLTVTAPIVFELQ